MLPLGLFLSAAGHRVAMWDDDETRTEWQALALRAGAVPLSSPDIPEDVAMLIHSPAVSPDHPLRVAASSREIPQMRRGIALSKALAGRRLLAVAGSHGKTSTMGFLAWIVDALDLPVDFLVGGRFVGDRLAPARNRSAAVVASEIDESDDSIEQFAPAVTALLNCEWDHPEQYPDREQTVDAFMRLATRTEEVLLVPDDLELPGSWNRAIEARIRTVGPAGDYRISVEPGLGTEFRLKLSGRFRGGVLGPLSGGRHQAMNAAMALALLEEAGCRLAERSLPSRFPGLQRRMETVFDDGCTTILQDYAHHPTELTRAIEHAREVAGERPLGIVFEGHRPSRMAAMADDFVRVLSSCGDVTLLPVYAAGEPPRSEGTAEFLRSRFPADRRPVLVEDAAAEPERLPDGPALILVAGAGVADQWAGRMAALLRKRSAEARQVDFARSAGGILGVDSVFREFEPLDDKTTIRLGGSARFYAEPGDEDELRGLIGHARRCGIPWFVLGRGSNLIVVDKGFAGLVIRLSRPHWRAIEIRDDGSVRAGAGARLKALCGATARAGVAGFEFIEGVPGSVGGALRMNAGAMGGWMFDVVESVRLLTPDGKIEERDRSAFTTGYRECRELRESVALEAVLRGSGRQSPPEIRHAIDVYAGRRRESQPREPSAGCIFRNPEGDHAGRLIDELGLKGMHVGDAAVSEVHANFIVNRGSATAGDVVELVRQIRSAVQRQRGIELNPEVLLLGSNWEELLQ